MLIDVLCMSDPYSFVVNLFRFVRVSASVRDSSRAFPQFCTLLKAPPPFQSEFDGSGVIVLTFSDLRKHGRFLRAYMDVLAACPERLEQ